MDQLSPGVHTFKAGEKTLSYHAIPSKKPNAPLWVTQAIHWGPGRQQYVKTLAPILSKHYTVLDFSPRGSDESFRPKDDSGNDDPSAMSVTNVTEDLESLRKHLGIETFHVLSGHSLAAVSVLLYASLHPTRVKNLIPIASGLFWDFDGTATWNHYRDLRSSQPQYAKAYERWASAKSDPPTNDEEFFRFLMDVLPSYVVDPERDCPTLVAAFEGSPMRLWCMRAYSSTRASDEKLHKLFDLLKNVKARVLFVHGEHDMGCPLEAVRIAEKRLKEEAGVEVEVAVTPVGHFPWVEDREGFERAVVGFMGNE